MYVCVNEKEGYVVGSEGNVKKIAQSQSLIFSPSLTAISVWESSGCLAFNLGPLDFVKSMYADRGCFGTWSLYWSREREGEEGGGRREEGGGREGKEGEGWWERREGGRRGVGEKGRGNSSHTLYTLHFTE